MKTPNFEKFAAEANSFIYELSEELQHPGSERETIRILRAVLHAIRDRISIQQSFHFMAQLPMFLKALYVQDWKYSPEPEKINTVEAFKERVKQYQHIEGEVKFEWEMPTEEMIRTVLHALKRYISEGEMNDVIGELPKELKKIAEAEHRLGE